MLDDIRSLFAQLSIIAVPVGFGVGIWWICDSVLSLAPPIPLIVTLAIMLLGFVGFFWWLVNQQKEENRVQGTIEHPLFGTIQQKKDSWEASLTLSDLGTDILVSSYEGKLPTSAQEETLTWIISHFNSITKKLESCLDDFDTEASHLPPKSRHLIIESILLDPAIPKTCCFIFDIAGSETPWGFSAFFSEGEIEELTENH